MIFNNIFLTTFKLSFRMHVKDLIQYRYMLILNILLAFSAVIVSVIIDVDKLSELTGTNNPWLFILAGFLLTSLINATFHMPRAFAESDIGTGRFEYIMTTKSYSVNYFWYYSVSLLIIQLFNLIPVLLIFITSYFYFGLFSTLSFNLTSFVAGFFLLIFAFILTILISTLNLYTSIISRRYQFNSSLLLVVLLTFAGRQFPLHAFPKPVQYLFLFNPVTISIELWRLLVIPGYISFVGTPLIIIAGVIHFITLLFLSRLAIKKMNSSIKINGVGKLLE